MLVGSLRLSLTMTPLGSGYYSCIRKLNKKPCYVNAAGRHLMGYWSLELVDLGCFSTKSHLNLLELLLKASLKLRWNGAIGIRAVVSRQSI